MNAPHVYVHVPFCRRRCVYCDFSIAVRNPVPVGEFLDALALEGERVAERIGGNEPSARAAPGSRPSTLYLGGGTPSLLGGEGVARITKMLQAGPGLDEFTLEANPDDVTPAAAAAWARAGVNRLSIGAQSFDDAVLAWMHRSHGAAAIAPAVESARRAGIGTVSLDLIFALPESRPRELDADLDRFLALEPEHVSLYGLTVEPHTALGRLLARGEGEAAPEARYEEEYLRIHERLAAAGYRFYEVSNAARPGAEAVHNRAYWRLEPYLGLGPSAHSFDGTSRWWNESAYAAWLRRLAAGESPVAGRELLRPEQRRLEALYLGLRTSEGVELPEPLTGTLAAALGAWVAAGWARTVGQSDGRTVGQADGRTVGQSDGRTVGQAGAMRVTLTPRGWLRLDELAACF